MDREFQYSVPLVDYSDLIGIPFSYGGRGPNRFDCYGLVMEMHRRHGVDLPDFASTDNQSIIQAMIGTQMIGSFWRECAMRPGSIIVFRVGKYVSHVGFVIDRFGHFIHTWEKSGGVVVERLDDGWKKRVVGFYEYAPS